MAVEYTHILSFDPNNIRRKVKRLHPFLSIRRQLDTQQYNGTGLYYIVGLKKISGYLFEIHYLNPEREFFRIVADYFIKLVFTVINTLKFSSVPYPVRNFLQDLARNFLLGNEMLKVFCFKNTLN